MKKEKPDKKEKVSPRLQKADNDVRELLEGTEPLDVDTNPVREEMERIAKGKRIKGKKL